MICLQNIIFWAQNLRAQKIGKRFPRMPPCLRAWPPVVIVSVLKVYICHISTVFLRKMLGTRHGPVEIRSL